MKAVRRPTGDGLTKGGLTLGYLALAAGVYVASNTPPTGYELSVYASTPLGFWVGALIAGTVAVAVAMRLDRHLPLALLLGGFGALAVVGLPLLRGYHFYGRADSLVHLGWARAINVGGDPMALFYPGSHLISAGLSMVGGIQITKAMMLVMFLYMLLFFVSVPLCVWLITPDRRALAIGTFSGFLLLPINNVSTYLHFHTYSITMLFVPFVLYLTFTHLLNGERGGGAGTRLSDGGRLAVGGTGLAERMPSLGHRSFRGVPTSYLLPVVSLALVLFHPQVALNVLILLGGIVVVQLWLRQYRTGHRLAGYRMLSLQTGALGLMFVVWIQTNEGAFVRTAGTLLDSILGFVSGSAETVPRVGSQADSAESIGVSIWELFAKLFGIEAVYGLLTAGVVLGKVTGRLDPPGERPTLQPSQDVGADLVTLLFFGGVALVPLFALHFLGSISTYLFRHVGFTMMLATILGPVGLHQLLSAAPTGGRRDHRSRGRLRSAGGWLARLLGGGRLLAVLVVVLVVALALATVFPSPFIYLPGSHVTEGEMDGYEATFASQSPGSPVWFGGIRTSSERYEQALYGAESAPWEEQVIPNPKKSAPVPAQAILGGLPAFYATHPEEIVRRDHYFMVSEADRERELGAYKSLRYSAAAFETLDAQPDVGRIRDNGQLTVYYVDISDVPPPSEDASETAGANASAVGTTGEDG
jgi:hypothetical protein